MFLPVVLPPLLAALEAEVKFSMEAADPDEDGEVRPALTPPMAMLSGSRRLSDRFPWKSSRQLHRAQVDLPKSRIGYRRPQAQ